MKAPLRILAVAALCIVTLVGLVVRESMARASGMEVLLAMEAVDPRALLQGHYVTIALREQLADGAPCPPTTAGPGADGWVALTSDGQVHHAAGGSGVRDEAAAHGPLLARGGFYCQETLDETGKPTAPAIVNLDLGIHAFYVAQREAERIDRILREQQAGDDARVYAIVSIGADGNARLKGLMVDGERLELNWL